MRTARMVLSLLTLCGCASMGEQSEYRSPTTLSPPKHPSGFETGGAEGATPIDSLFQVTFRGITLPRGGTQPICDYTVTYAGESADRYLPVGEESKWTQIVDQAGTPYWVKFTCTDNDLVTEVTVENPA